MIRSIFPVAAFAACCGVALPTFSADVAVKAVSPSDREFELTGELVPAS